MQISIIAVGTIGDVVPYAALGLGLQAAGHQVRLIAFQKYEQIVRESGLDFWAITGDIQKLMDMDWSQSYVGRGSSLRSLSKGTRLLQRLLEQLMKDCWMGSQGADIILGSVAGDLAARPVAQKLRIPYCAAYVSPLHRTRAFPNSFSLFPKAPGWSFKGKGVYNTATHALSSQLFWLWMRPILHKAQLCSLHLSPNLPVQRAPVLYGYSPTLLPKPAEWDEHISVTGYWFLNQADTWQPPSQLTDFLASGPKPIYVGFGSMTGRYSHSIVLPIIEALTKAQQRCILLMDREKLTKDLPDSVFCINFVPHDWLFPRVAGVIHHGGAGTTAQALRVSVPQMIIPFIVDQHFWAHLVSTLKLGPSPLDHKRLIPAQLQSAITMIISNRAIQERCATIGERIRAEDGVAQAVEALHRYVPMLKA